MCVASIRSSEEKDEREEKEKKKKQRLLGRKEDVCREHAAWIRSSEAKKRKEK